MSLCGGDTVFLLRHIDQEWLEGKSSYLISMHPSKLVNLVRNTLLWNKEIIVKGDKKTEKISTRSALKKTYKNKYFMFK